MAIYLGSNSDDTVNGLTFFDEAGTLAYGSFNGFDGYDTVGFEALTTGWIWFQPTLTIPNPIVQNTNTVTFPLPGEVGLFHLMASFISIEHIIAGSGDDLIYLPEEAIHFEAGGGHDTFVFADAAEYAGNGYSFASGHVLDGGSGTDTLDLRPDVAWPAGYVIDMLYGTGERLGWPNGGDFALASIEIVYGSAGTDLMRAGWTTELLDGGDGDDTFDLNDHFLVAGVTYNGGAGVDTLDFSREYGDFHVDLSLAWLEQSDAPFPLYAYVGGIEVVDAGHGDDILIGDDGRNQLRGNTGLDEIHGNGGNDLLRGGRGDDTLFGDNGKDKLFGQNGPDDLFGGKGKDRLDGGKGQDVLRGGNHDDRLLGGGGFDILDGGHGDDVLRGQGGADAFVFTDGDGHDRVRDFDPGEGDFIDFVHLSTINSFADLLAASSEHAAGVLIETGADSSIQLKGLTLADLSANDFYF